MRFFLPTHADCNNRFGPETYVTKALDLLELLVSADGHSEFQHRDHPHITIKALDASKLPNFTRRDIVFFKFMDVRDEDYDVWSKPEFFNGKTKTNPTRDALHVAFSVLAKSAAALLIKRDLHAVPPAWRIYAAPYSGATDALDFGDLPGETKSFDSGVHVWRKPLNATDWIMVYRAWSALLFLIFVFSGEDAGATLGRPFQDAEAHEFSGTSLNDLLATGWRKLQPPSPCFPDLVARRNRIQDGRHRHSNAHARKSNAFGFSTTCHPSWRSSPPSPRSSVRQSGRRRVMALCGAEITPQGSPKFGFR